MDIEREQNKQRTTIYIFIDNNYIVLISTICMYEPYKQMYNDSSRFRSPETIKTFSYSN